jgi:hypothetical protein
MSEGFVGGGAGMSVSSSCEAHGLHVRRVCRTDKKHSYRPRVIAAGGLDCHPMHHAAAPRTPGTQCYCRKVRFDP